MREIKLRYRFKHYKTGELITTCLSMQDIEIQGITPNPFQSLEWTILSRDEYTGLKDKNGKEIYEGDILEKIYRWLRHYVVEYKMGGFGRTIGFSARPLGKTATKTNNEPLFLSNTHYDTEVIGNIYENPELVG